MIRGLPYDAELEYLESTGTQYIDTGVKKTSGTTIDCTFSLAATNTKAVFGGRTGAANSDRLALFAFNSNFRFDAGSQVYLYTPDTTSKFRFQYDGTNAVLTNLTTGVVDTQAVSIGEAGTVNIVLFGVSTNGEISAKLEGRIYSFKLWQNGVLVRDLIPVRVGSGASAVGYMYDRVSRRLFGNAGSGAFVLGPDKAVPILSLHSYASPSNGIALGKMGCTDLFHRITAKDYVQSGLVAMWDGIENAGWGTHSDDTSVTWTDLILGVSISFGTWRMRGDLSRFIFVGNRVNNFDRASLPQSVLSALTSGADTTIEIVCGDPTASGNEAIVAAITDASTFYGQGGVFAGGGTAGIGLRNNLNGVRYPSPAVVKTLAPGVMATYSAVVSNGTVYGYRNGEKLNVSLGADTSKVATSTLLQRMYAYASIRLSSRALTADEIARNYRVDKARFNLP